MNSSAVRALALEYKSLNEDPVEGFRVKLLNDENLFEWTVRSESVCARAPMKSASSQEINDRLSNVTHEIFCPFSS